jgi:hypothetical protein
VSAIGIGILVLAGIVGGTALGIITTPRSWC